MKRYIIFFISFVVFAPAIGQKSDNKGDSISDKIVAYKYFYDYSGLYRTPIDTAIKHFQIYNPAFSNFSINQYNGNLGLAMESNLANERQGYTDFLFDQHVRYNFHKHGDIIYYKTNSPFTFLNYFTGGPKSRQEQKLDILHTQNVNEKLSIGFLGSLSSSDGEFSNQKASKNCFTIFSAYDGKRYNYHFAISMNSLKANQNGGVIDSLYENLEEVEANTLPVSLTAASSRTRNFSIFLQHRFYITGSYKIDTEQEDTTQISAIVKDSIVLNDSLTTSAPKKTSKWNEVLSLIHQLNYSRNIRAYSDNLITQRYDGSLEREYYRDIYIDSTQTKDSLYFRRFENTFFLAVNAKPIFNIPAELRFGIKNQLDLFSYNIPLDSTLDNGTYHYKSRNNKVYVNTAIVGTLANRFSETITFGASAELYFTGYKAGDIRLLGDISKTIGNNFKMTLSGDFKIEKPQYFIQDFESNHFLWHNNFQSKQSSNILKVQISHEKYKIYLEGMTATYINYCYFNALALPEVAESPFVVNMISLKKYFELKFFHTMFKVSLQNSGNEKAISLPAFTGFNSTYFEFQLVKNVLRLQLGFDVFYNSEFYAKAYMPATGMYYTQDSKKIGNYPYSDVFLNMKLKRVRFSLKYENITSLFKIQKGYFVPHYPYNPGIIKFGVSWTFYD